MTEPDAGHFIQFETSDRQQPFDWEPYESSGKTFFDGRRPQLEPGGSNGLNVPRVELHTNDLVHTWTWQNMIGDGVMDLLDIDEPPVITLTTAALPLPEHINQLLDILDQLVAPHVRTATHSDTV